MLQKKYRKLLGLSKHTEIYLTADLKSKESNLRNNNKSEIVLIINGGEYL